MSGLEQEIREVGRKAREASRRLARAGGLEKRAAIETMAVRLVEAAGEIEAANRLDMDAALVKGMAAHKLERLQLNAKRVEGLARACLEVAAMPDPIGGIEDMTVRPNGMMVGRMRQPLGVIAMIFESRPGVVVESSILCLLAGNAVILRPGSEAFYTARALEAVVGRALVEAGLPAAAVQVLPTTDRAAVGHLLKLEEFIDVVIPRGGEGLIRAVVEQAAMPVLKHYKGVCHAYVDAGSDLREAVMVIHNAKVSRPSVCNSLECVLAHIDEADGFLALLAEKLGKDSGVQFRACPRSLPILKAAVGDAAVAANDDDWGYEFLDLILAVKVVGSMDEALAHIATYGSNHTEIILTRDHGRAMRFLREADASMVAVNASSRFNDGGELGLGAEIGISTSKLHAYGPMGVKELTTTKFVVLGQGQVRG